MMEPIGVSFLCLAAAIAMLIGVSVAERRDRKRQAEEWNRWEETRRRHI